MSELTVIDGFEFARMGRSLIGKIDVSRMDRLTDLLYSRSGQVDYALTGEVDAKGDYLLHLALGGMLHLRCQRCLEDIEYPLELKAGLKLVKEESDLPDIEEEDPEVDSIVVRDRMEILPLIEDEILLDLPFSPRHAACESGSEIVRESPFSILKDRI